MCVRIVISENCLNIETPSYDNDSDWEDIVKVPRDNEVDTSEDSDSGQMGLTLI